MGLRSSGDTPRKGGNPPERRSGRSAPRNPLHTVTRRAPQQPRVSKAGEYSHLPVQEYEHAYSFDDLPGRLTSQASPSPPWFHQYHPSYPPENEIIDDRHSATHANNGQYVAVSRSSGDEEEESVVERMLISDSAPDSRPPDLSRPSRRPLRHSAGLSSTEYASVSSKTLSNGRRPSAPHSYPPWYRPPLARVQSRIPIPRNLWHFMQKLALALLYWFRLVPTLIKQPIVLISVLCVAPFLVWSLSGGRLQTVLSATSRPLVWLPLSRSRDGSPLPSNTMSVEQDLRQSLDLQSRIEQLFRTAHWRYVMPSLLSDTQDIISDFRSAIRARKYTMTETLEIFLHTADSYFGSLSEDAIRIGMESCLRINNAFDRGKGVLHSLERLSNQPEQGAADAFLNRYLIRGQSQAQRIALERDQAKHRWSAAAKQMHDDLTPLMEEMRLIVTRLEDIENTLMPLHINPYAKRVAPCDAGQSDVSASTSLGRQRAVRYEEEKYNELKDSERLLAKMQELSGLSRHGMTTALDRLQHVETAVNLLQDETTSLEADADQLLDIQTASMKKVVGRLSLESAYCRKV